MKKIVFCWLLFLVFLPFINSQTVDSIKVEQAGDFIKIRYKILNSTPDQVYRVKVLCSMDGGMNYEIRSITGDVGEQVPGGKSEYWIVWDVLKDVEELKSVEFIVRAEMAKGNSVITSKVPKVKGPSAHRFHLMPSLQLPGPGYGLRFGYMGKAGFSLQYIMTSGKKLILPDVTYDNSNPRLDRFSLDLTARIVNKESFQTHLLIGIVNGEFIKHYPSSQPDDYTPHMAPGLDAGFCFYFRRIAFSVSGARLFISLTEQDDIIVYSKSSFLTFDFGVRF